MADRSLEQINEIADIAGVTNRHGPIQSLYFSSEFTKRDLKLLEIPEDVLRSLKSGDKVTFRGAPNEEAVLCTEDNTYDVKTKDTSNALLLVPDLKHIKSNDIYTDDLIKLKVNGYVTSYFELKKINPRTEKLKYLLEKSYFNGDENEDSTIEKFSLYDLLNHVQASKREIIKELEKLNAIELKGRWRLLHPDYYSDVGNRILSSLEEMGWRYYEVPMKECCKLLENLYPSYIVSHCLKSLGKAIHREEDTGEVIYQLIEDEVCKFCAVCLLRPAGKFHYHEFMDAWKETVPEGIETFENQLKGIALSEPFSSPPVIWYFPANDLSPNPSSRFDILFRTRSEWSYDDIEPYISGIVSPGLSLNALLLKYTRCSTDSLGKKIYTTKRPLL